MKFAVGMATSKMMHTQLTYKNFCRGWINSYRKFLLLTVDHIFKSLKKSNRSWQSSLTSPSPSPRPCAFVLLGLKATKYEIQKPSAFRVTLFRCKFWSMCPIFQLAWSTCRATKAFVTGWRTLLRKVERGSSLSNKFLALLSNCTS